MNKFKELFEAKLDNSEVKFFNKIFEVCRNADSTQRYKGEGCTVRGNTLILGNLTRYEVKKGSKNFDELEKIIKWFKKVEDIDEADSYYIDITAGHGSEETSRYQKQNPYLTVKFIGNGYYACTSVRSIGLPDFINACGYDLS